jgi:membrane protein YqaA with SNARE-associated domain
MVTPIELFMVLITAFGLGIIPFAGPSTLLIASNTAVILGVTDVPTLVAIACLVALGSALAKSVHYMVTFFVRRHLSSERQKRLNTDGQKIKHWAALALFIVAVTPIPDEPVVIPLGLMKYSPIKFFISYFSGKLIVTAAGAFLGSWTGQTLLEWLSPQATIVISILLTVVITIVLLKVDLGKLIKRIQGWFKNHGVVFFGHA